MIHRKQIVWFEEVGKGDVGLVGGKGANLGEMTSAGFPIPYGFIVTSRAYFEFIEEARLLPKIRSVLSVINFENPHELHQVSSHIKELMAKASTPHSLIKKVVDYYEDLPIREDYVLSKVKNPFKHAAYRLKHLYSPPLVAVRSSATAEDLPNASFAGQQETYLNVKGENQLLKKIKDCWASLFTERAIYYRHQQGFDHTRVGLAAVIQRMVQSEKSGIAFSIDPVTNDRTKIVIEAVYGLGEYIVQGKVTPDHYEVDKRSLVITKTESHYQTARFVRSGKGNREVRLTRRDGSQTKLSSEEITKIALAVRDIEKHYYFPQDIEWAIEGKHTFIVQSRPITTIKDAQTKSEVTVHAPSLIPLAVGAPASPGVATGPARLVSSPSEIEVIHSGDVLVAPQTNPDFVPAMRRASAIVTERGGRTSHAAIVSRELGVPAVVGAEHAMRLLKNDMVVTVNGSTGEIFRGKPHITSPSQSSSTHFRSPKTLTKIYVNLAEPDQAERVAAMHVDGVGLLRAEFMIAEIGIHPKEFIKQKKEHIFVKSLAANLIRFSSAFSPRPIVYRATDFKTNEYRHLKGGAHYEPKEENPMLGFRGAFRYITNPEVFGMELEAIRMVLERGFTNLHLMIPFVRVPWELIKIREMVKSYGLFDYPGFKFLMMVEVPAAALNLKEFIRIGIDGVSIGTNDLTMMLLGDDRDNEKVSAIYDERNPVVVSVLETIVNQCKEARISCSICGQAASDYPELVERLVKLGITSVSVNPDAVDKTRSAVYEIEKHLFAHI